MFFRRTRKPGSARREVCSAWIGALPHDKSELFDTVVRRWESTYAMLSVALDEALALRAQGQLVRARQQVPIVTELLLRLAAALVSASGAMWDRGRHMGDLPVVNPLTADFFQGYTAQRAAYWNGLLHRVVLGDRSRFFHKLRTLSATIQRVAGEFVEASRHISEGLSTRPGACWDLLSPLHYDLSTCLRETEVVFKCFLRSLPNEQMALFSAKMEEAPEPLQFEDSRPRAMRASAWALTKALAPAHSNDARRLSGFQRK